MSKVSNAISDVGLVVKAAAFAAHKHRDQRRKGANAEPYINHPIGLANVLAVEAAIADLETICAAILHDTIEDTETNEEELQEHFGKSISDIVMEVTDDKKLLKEDRKLAQIEHAATASHKAKLVKLADKICNLRDIIEKPPTDWSLERRQNYFDWAKEVIDGVRGTHPKLEDLFDQIYAQRP